MSDFVITLEDSSRQFINTGTFALWRSDGGFDGSVSVPGSFVANGQWKFSNVPDGIYKLRNVGDSSFVAGFGGDNGRWIGDNALPYIPDSGTHSSGVTLTLTNPVTVGNASAGGHAMNRDTADGRYGQKTGNNTWFGSNTFAATPTISLPATNPNDVISLGQVQALINLINVAQYQESSTKRRVIAGGTVETNKVYTDILTAVNSLSGIGATNKGLINIVRVPSSATTVTGGNLAGGIINFPTGALAGNVLYKGQGQITKLCYTNSLTLSVSCEFENLVLYFSEINLAGARTITNAKFRNCTIICFNAIEFGNGAVLENCNVITSATNGITFSGTSVARFVSCNNAVTDTSSNDNLIFEGAGFASGTDPVSIPS